MTVQILHIPTPQVGISKPKKNDLELGKSGDHMRHDVDTC